MKRRRRGVDWTVLVQLVAMVPSLRAGLGIVILVISPGPGICPQQAGVGARWAPFGAAALWFLLGFVWFAPFLQSFLAQSVGR
ncbi:hypothetical protein KNN17_21630 [Arthrobacter bambusae]|uniref:hypothetical protein n=1 Tax=Arthrobacter bambusae TaxID=1338426 RepID=UPI001F50E1F0|nr:hypothetical protein [Arthrobacter bambusae]MCI0144153.1 hypothetical protein [Arthrobacter bambusae]